MLFHFGNAGSTGRAEGSQEISSLLTLQVNRDPTHIQIFTHGHPHAYMCIYIYIHICT